MAVVDNFVWESVKPFYNKPLEGIRQFAKLEREETNPFPSGATAHTLHFPGLVVAGLAVPGKGFFLQRVEVTTKSYPLSGGLAIGSRAPDVLARLGRPTEESVAFLKFNGETEKVIFHLQDKQVARVELLVYTD